MAQSSASQVKRGGYRDLREYLVALEAAGLLSRVPAEVDLKGELGAICARSLERNGPAILFENIKGYPGMTLAANILATDERVALALGVDDDQEQLGRKILEGMENRLPSVVLPSGPSKEEITQGDAVDVYQFPTPWWHELDAGQFIGTTHAFITADPDTGAHNLGSYRVMIKDKNTLSVQIRGSHPVGEKPSPGDRTGARADGLEHILTNEQKGLPTPCAIALSMDPYLTMAGGTSVPVDAEGMAEYEAAGGWRGSPTELVKTETGDLLVPAHAEIIIEGEVVPNVRTPEGPHGESNGFYVGHQETFLVKVKAITNRQNPVSYGLYCWMVEDYPRDIFRGASFHRRLVEGAGLTNIKRVQVAKVGRNGMVIISARIRDAEDPKRIIEAAWKNGGERWVVVVDEDCDVRSWTDVLWRVTYFARPEHHIIQGGPRSYARAASTPGEVDDPFEPPESGLGIDATMHFKGYQFNPVNRVTDEMRTRIASRWGEYGLP